MRDIEQANLDQSRVEILTDDVRRNELFRVWGAGTSEDVLLGLNDDPRFDEVTNQKRAEVLLGRSVTTEESKTWEDWIND